MTNEKQITTLVTGGAVVTGLVVAAYSIAPYFSHKEEVACGASASRVEQMTVKAPTGRLMTPIELQTKIGRQALGVVRNARVVNVSDASFKEAIEVSLSKGSTSPRLSRQNSGGVAFDWSPGLFATAKSVCLRYALKIPKDFEPGNGGIFPGLFGGKHLPIAAESDGNTGFAIHSVWRQDGRLELFAQIPTNTVSNPAMIRRNKFDVARGRWVWVDQKITLNTPGHNDGAFKLWIDGKVRFDDNHIAWRNDANLSLTGVSASLYYGTPKRPSVAPITTAIGLSPFQLSWR